MPLDPQAEFVSAWSSSPVCRSSGSSPPSRLASSICCAWASWRPRSRSFAATDRSHRRAGQRAAHPYLPAARAQARRAVARAGVVPRRRLRHRQSRHPRLGLPDAGQSGRLPGGGGRLSSCTRVQVSCRGGRQHGGAALGGAARARARRRSRAYCSGGRQRRRQPRGRVCPAGSQRRPPAARVPAADLPLHGTRAGDALAPEIRRRLCAHAQRDHLVLQAVRAQRRRTSTTSASRRWSPTICPICRPRWCWWRASIRCATKASTTPNA